jgi:NADPH2:quinone reductase
VRAVYVTRNGGPEVLEVVDRPVPSAGDRQIVARLAYAGVNFADVAQRRGGSPLATPPYIPGSEGVGLVTQVGPGVTEVAPGDRVVLALSSGSYAEYIAASVDRVVKLPEGISEEAGAAIFAKGLTAHYLATDSYPIKPGDTVLVHAAAGGVGYLLTRIAKHEVRR